jgi:hypothetical protein
MFGPDITFLGVDPCDLEDPASFSGADVVVVGAPFDGGTSHRPGTRFGPQAIRSTDYLPHDGSRPHLALRVDPLRDLRVLDLSGDWKRDYPSHLHIDIVARAQGCSEPYLLGRGLGRSLIETLLASLKAAGSRGVHLGIC